jgi:hypothetical protein
MPSSLLEKASACPGVLAGHRRDMQLSITALDTVQVALQEAVGEAL